MARKVPVFGLGIGEWIVEVNNAIASRDRAISSDNSTDYSASPSTLLSCRIKIPTIEEIGTTILKYASHCVLNAKAFDLCAIIVFSG